MDDPVDGGGGGGGGELRLLKKRLHYGRMSNSGRCVVSLGMELWNGMEWGTIIVVRRPWERVMIVISKLICIFTAHRVEASRRASAGFCMLREEGMEREEGTS